ncbi:hypothetical protein K6025_03225 [Ehrlichia sp. JZT12]
MNQELSTTKQLIYLIDDIMFFLFVITFALSVMLLPIVSCICELAGVHSLILYKVNVILLIVPSILLVSDLITQLFISPTTEEEKKLEQSKDTSTEEQKESKQSKDISTEEQKKLKLIAGHIFVIGYFAFYFYSINICIMF